MFTGIIRHFATVVYNQGTELCIAYDQEENFQIGDSISINGVCLTIASHSKENRQLVFGIGPDTYKQTTLSTLAPSRRVHLESALVLGEKIGGHFIQGHVDGTGTLAYIEKAGDCLLLKFNCPETLLALCVSKGSITIDGVSLTIQRIFKDGFEVGLIPHTLQSTLFSQMPLGQAVNLEMDLIAKYVRQLTLGYLDASHAATV